MTALRSCARLLLALVAVVPLEALAAQYYVNDGTTTGDVVPPGCASAVLGNDTTGCGTCAAPCRTPNFLYANTALVPGDIVHLNAGDYTPAPLSTSALIDATNPTKAGTNAQPITFRGTTDVKGKPLTRFNGQGTGQAGVNITVPWIAVESISVTNTGCPGSAPFGSGVFVAQTSLAGVTIDNVEVFGMVCAFGAPIDYETVANPCSGCRISRCNLHDNGALTGAGIFAQGLGGLVVSRNIITGNALGTGGFPAINIQGAPGAIVEGNLVYGNGGAALFLGRCAGCPAADTIAVRGNTFWRNQLASTGNSIAEVVLNQAVTNLTLEDNIVGCAKNSCLDADTAVTFTSSNFNDFLLSGTASFGRKGGSTAADLTAWKGVSAQDAQSLSVDPLFGGATDFHLKSISGRPDALTGARVFDAQSSPLIDRANPGRALGGEPLPSGGRVDIGAYGSTPESSLTPVQLATLSGDGQSGPAGQQLPVPLLLSVSDLGTARSEPGLSITWSVLQGGATIGTPAAITDGVGRASTVVTPGLGVNQIRASIAGLGIAPVAFTVYGLGPDGGLPDAGTPDAGSAADAGAGSDAGQNPSDAGVGGRISSTPETAARCQETWSYQPVAAPAQSWTWSAPVAPEGVTIDATTGVVTWTPSAKQRGTQTVTVRAEAGVANVEQTFEVQVECLEGLSLGTGCTCGSGAGSLLFGAWLMGASALRRRRKRGQD